MITQICHKFHSILFVVDNKYLFPLDTCGFENFIQYIYNIRFLSTNKNLI